MMLKKNLLIILLFIGMLTACAPRASEVNIVEPTIVQEETTMPANTQAPSPVPAAPEPTARNTENLEPIDFALEPISVENAVNLTQVADWNNISDVSSIAFSPDGQFFLAGLSTGDLKMWRVSDGELIHQFSGHTDDVLDIEFSPDAYSIASSSSDKTVRLWDVTNGEALGTLAGHTAKVPDIAYAPDSRRIISVSMDTTARVWNVEDGSLVYELTDHTGGVTAVVFSPDGKTIVTGSKDKSVRVWEAASGKLITTLDFSKLGSSAFDLSVRFTTDGKQLAIRNSFNGSVGIYNTAGYDLIKKFQGLGYGNPELILSTDDRLAINGSVHSGLNIINIETGDNLISLDHQGGIRAVIMSSDGRLLVSLNENLHLFVWGVKM